MAPGITALLAILAAVYANIAYASQTGGFKLAAWLVTLVAIVALCASIGRGISERWDALLIDSRNRVSLSRLQMFAWTVLLLSALTTAAASNLHISGNIQALAIDIPGELLAAMGIATTSLAATPALLKLKDAGGGNTLLAKNKAATDAGWLEIFRGDETNSAGLPDLSKVQQFLITLVLVGGYAVLIGNVFLDPGQLGPAPGPGPAPQPGTIWTLPPIDEKFIWLLGISHAGYLGYKAASLPRNPQPQPEATPVSPAAPTTGEQ